MTSKYRTEKAANQARQSLEKGAGYTKGVMNAYDIKVYEL